MVTRAMAKKVPLGIPQDMGLMHQEEPVLLYQQAQGEQLKGDGERLQDKSLLLSMGCCIKWEGQR